MCEMQNQEESSSKKSTEEVFEDLWRPSTEALTKACPAGISTWTELWFPSAMLPPALVCLFVFSTGILTWRPQIPHGP